jgi:hypothetical protein
MHAIPFVVWLRPVRSDERVGEHNAVVCQFVYVRPFAAEPVDVRRLDQAAPRPHRRVADVVEHDVEDVGRALRRHRLQVRLPVGRRVPRVDVDDSPERRGHRRRHSPFGVAKR